MCRISLADNQIGSFRFWSISVPCSCLSFSMSEDLYIYGDGFSKTAFSWNGDLLRLRLFHYRREEYIPV